jgi:hypothetical protein
MLISALLWSLVVAPVNCRQGCRPPSGIVRFYCLRRCESTKAGMAQQMLMFNAYGKSPMTRRMACVYGGGQYPLWRLGRRPQSWSARQQREQARRNAPVLKEPLKPV